MEALLKQIKEQFEFFTEDATRLVDKANKTAGARSRKASLEIEKLLKLWRKTSVKI